MSITRYTFTGTLVLAGALHIGSGGGGKVGENESLTDATVIRDSRGYPYIPGSSLRGVLRTVIGQIGPQVFGSAISEIRDDAQIDAAVEDARQQQDLTEADYQKLLEQVLRPAERLFGTVYWASPLLVPDLHLGVGQSGDGEIRHGVGIDRDTGAARETFKYDFEVLPRDTTFAFWMRCDVPDTCAMPNQPQKHAKTWPHLLALGLRFLEQGEMTLGGRAARGVGQVRLDNLQTYLLTMGDRQALIQALLADHTSSMRYGELVEGWVEQRIKEIPDVYSATT